MNCRVSDMRHKEVINIKDGTRLGSVSDIEIDTTDSKVVAIVVYGRLRFFGLFGREDDIIIKWKDIEIIGDDTILVNYNAYLRTKKRQQGFWGLFGGN